MTNKTIIVTVISATVLIFAWFIQYYNLSLLPISQTTSPQPASVSPPLSDTPIERIAEPKAAVPPESVQPQGEKVTEPLSADKAVRIEKQSPNLTEFNYSSPRKKIKTIEITPGVTVKDKVVHFELEQGGDKTLELERNPANSDNDYQLMWKNKF